MIMTMKTTEDDLFTASNTTSVKGTDFKRRPNNNKKANDNSSRLFIKVRKDMQTLTDRKSKYHKAIENEFKNKRYDKYNNVRGETKIIDDLPMIRKKIQEEKEKGRKKNNFYSSSYYNNNNRQSPVKRNSKLSSSIFIRNIVNDDERTRNRRGITGTSSSSMMDDIIKGEGEENYDNIIVENTNIPVILGMEERLNTNQLVYVSPGSRYRSCQDMKERVSLLSTIPTQQNFDIDYLNNSNDKNGTTIMTTTMMTIDNDEVKKYMDMYFSLKSKVELWEHQKDIVIFMKNRECDFNNINCFGGMICDEMGLGKSLAIIQRIFESILEDYKATNERFNGCTLIVCSKTLIINWMDEFMKFFPNGTFQIILLCEDKNKGADKFIIEKCTDIVITTYPTLTSAHAYMKRRDKAKWDNTVFDEDEHKYLPLFKVKWKRVISDEGQTFVNTSSKIYSAMINLISEHMWFVSGTPIQNYLVDLYAALKFIKVDDKLIPYTLRESIRCSVKSQYRRQNSNNEEEVEVFNRNNKEIRDLLFGKKIMIRRLKEDLSIFNYNKISKEKDSISTT